MNIEISGYDSSMMPVGTVFSHMLNNETDLIRHSLMLNCVDVNSSVLSVESPHIWLAAKATNYAKSHHCNFKHIHFCIIHQFARIISEITPNVAIFFAHTSKTP